MANTNVAQKEPSAAQEPKRWSHGAFYWNELMTPDVERAKRFYADTLGWRFEGMPMPSAPDTADKVAGMTYWIVYAGEQMVGGMFEMNCTEMAGAPEQWLGHIAVDDVDKRYEKALAAGATTMRPPFDVPMVGRIAIINQPGGAAIGWITPAS